MGRIIRAWENGSAIDGTNSILWPQFWTIHNFFLHLWMHFRFYQCAKYSVILMEVRAQLWYLQIPHISSAHCYFASLNFDELIPECHYLLPELRIRNTEHCLCAVKLPQKHWWSRGQPSESHRSVGLLAVFDSLCHGRLRPPGFQR